MSFNGTVIGSPTFGSVKFGTGLTATSDSNYISLPAGASPSAMPVTWECWLQTTATTTLVALGDISTSAWMGVNSSGHFIASNGGVSCDSGIAINDGVPHWCVVVFTATTIYTFVDAAMGATASSGFSDPGNSLDIGRFGFTTGFAWPGGIAEVAIWNGQQYSRMLRRLHLHLTVAVSQI